MAAASPAPRLRRFGRGKAAAALSIALLLASVQQVAAATPANDLVGNAQQVALDASVEFDSTDATISSSDPTDCDGSHGTFPGPYFASVWFSATAPSAG